MLFSSTSSAIISVIATLVAALAALAIKSATGATSLWAGLASAGIVVALSLVVYFRAELAAMLSRNANWRVPRRVSSTWSYIDRERGKIEVEDVLELRQIGSFISGNVAATINRPGNAPLATYRYSIKASINQEGVIVGQWKSDETGRNYYGLLVLRFERCGQAAAGGWLGIGQSGVRNGEWSWRVTDK